MCISEGIDEFGTFSTHSLFFSTYITEITTNYFGLVRTKQFLQFPELSRILGTFLLKQDAEDYGYKISSRFNKNKRHLQSSKQTNVFQDY
jgi:hypothetical protein